MISCYLLLFRCMGLPRLLCVLSVLLVLNGQKSIERKDPIGSKIVKEEMFGFTPVLYHIFIQIYICFLLYVVLSQMFK